VGKGIRVGILVGFTDSVFAIAVSTAVADGYNEHEMQKPSTICIPVFRTLPLLFFPLKHDSHYKTKEIGFFENLIPLKNKYTRESVSEKSFDNYQSVSLDHFFLECKKFI
jgi:hypothetical protein